MLTCLLKRFVPFVLTLALGVLVGAPFRHHASPSERYMRFTHFGPTDYCACPLRNYNGSSGAVIHYKPEALYTREARRDHIAGTVALKLTLRSDGTVADITPLASLPDGLTEEAIKAAQRIEFIPAYDGGYPSDSVRVVEYYFDGRSPYSVGSNGEQFSVRID